MSFFDADFRALYRLVYFSRAEIRGAEDLPAMMQAILATAVPKNKGAGVSGALLACDKWFVQVLEGDRLTVGEIYSRICGDRRHRDAKVIGAAPIEIRGFAQWSMCGQTLSPTDDAIIKTLETKKSFDPAALTTQTALKLLEAVRNLQVQPVSAVYL